MRYHSDGGRGWDGPIRDRVTDERARLLTDGGEDGVGGEDGEADDERPEESVEESAVGETSNGPDPEGSNVEITDEAEPADPKWEKPDLDDIPEFEIRAEGPTTKDPGRGAGAADPLDTDGEAADPGAGMPNTARSPEATRISAEGTDAFIVALEMCVRLPEDVRLPEQAAELVPAAVEAELEEDIQQFVLSEFGTGTPHVDVLTFEEVDDEIWLRLRIGLPSEGFRNLDPEEIRSYALEELEGVF